MKKLTNISPFLLLLVPVFVMMLLTIASTTKENNNEVATKDTPTINSVIKAVRATL